MTKMRALGPPAVLVLAVLAAAQSLWWAGSSSVAAVRADGPATLDDLLALTAIAGCALLLGWVVLALAATAASALPGTAGALSATVAHRVTPAATRRVARLVVGLGVASAPLVATVPLAQADVRTPPVASATDTTADLGEPAGLHLPPVGRPIAGGDGAPSAGDSVGAWTPPPPPPPSPAAAPPAPAAGGSRPQVHLVSTAPGAGEAVSDEVVVRRGDTLWDIAARHLDPAASDAEIAAEWPRWYAANRAVIGDDPDLLFPGTVLRVPDRPAS